MIIGYTTTIDAYRARTAASRPLVLRKAKCACGKEVNSVQMKRHGQCITCMREAAK
jgi:hypothetical protein